MGADHSAIAMTTSRKNRGSRYGRPALSRRSHIRVHRKPLPQRRLFWRATFRAVSIFVTVALLTGCAWVKLTPEGEKVRVLSAQEVASCKKKGETTVSLRDKVAGIGRNKDKVKAELEMLARNAAPDLDGDTVVPASEIVDGKQTFDVYRCIGN